MIWLLLVSVFSFRIEIKYIKCVKQFFPRQKMAVGKFFKPKNCFAGLIGLPKFKTAFI